MLQFDSRVSWSSSILILFLVMFTNSTVEIGRKLLMTKIQSPLLVLTVRSGLQALLLLIIYSTYEDTAIIPIGLWLNSSINWINSGLLFMGSFLYLRALQSSSLSSTIPLLSITPVWVLFAGIVWQNELPDATSCLGIGAIIIGYLLQCASTRPAPTLSSVTQSSSSTLLSISSPSSLLCSSSSPPLPPQQQQQQREGDFLLQYLIPAESGQQAMLLVSLLWSFSSSIERNNANIGTDPTIVAMLTQALVCFYGCGLLSAKWMTERVLGGGVGSRSYYYKNDYGHPQHHPNYDYDDDDDDHVGKYSKPRSSAALRIGFIAYVRSELNLHNIIIFFITSFASIISFWIFSMATQTEYIGYVVAAKRLSMLTTLYIERSIMVSLTNGATTTAPLLTPLVPLMATKIPSTTMMTSTTLLNTGATLESLSSTTSTYPSTPTTPSASTTTTALRNNHKNSRTSTLSASCLQSLQSSSGGKWDMQLYASFFMSTGSILLML